MGTARRSGFSSRRAQLIASLATLALFLGAGVITMRSASAYSLLCNQTGIGCITQYGYTGQSIWGYPVDAAGNNCTNYAAFRLSRNGASNPGNLGNAGDWAASARSKGFPVDGTPVVGAIAQWNYGSSYAPTSGHVAYVEEVTGSDIMLSDSNWQGGSKRWRVSPGDRQWPSNFIHIKDVGSGGIGEGSFVSYQSGVYRIAGGAPIYVSNWAAVGGTQPTSALNDAQWNALRPFPVDNTLVSDSRGAVFKIAGGAPIYVSNWANTHYLSRQGLGVG